jgi:hypothetical protein
MVEGQDELAEDAVTSLIARRNLVEEFDGWISGPVPGRLAP